MSEITAGNSRNACRSKGWLPSKNVLLWDDNRIRLPSSAYAGVWIPLRHVGRQENADCKDSRKVFVSLIPQFHAQPTHAMDLQSFPDHRNDTSWDHISVLTEAGRIGPYAFLPSNISPYLDAPSTNLGSLPMDEQGWGCHVLRPRSQPMRSIYLWFAAVLRYRGIFSAVSFFTKSSRKLYYVQRTFSNPVERSQRLLSCGKRTFNLQYIL